MMSWSFIKLREFARLRSGYPFRKNQWKNAGVPVVKIRNIINGRINSDKCSYVSEKDAIASEFLLHPDDVVISLTGYVGEVAHVRADEMLVLNQRVGKFFLTEKCDKNFLYYLVLNKEFKSRVESISHGTAQKNISPFSIEELDVFVPTSIKEQKSVTKSLLMLDNKIESNCKIIKTLEQTVQLIFKDWFVNFGPTRAKMVRQEPYLPQEIWSMFPDNFDEEGKPSNWRKRIIDDIAAIKGGKMLHASNINKKGEIPVFGGAGCMGYTDHHNAEGWVITFGRVGAYCGQFFWHKGRAWINNNASLVEPKNNRNYEWLYLCISNLNLNAIRRGAAQPFVSNSGVASLEIITPTDNIMSKFCSLVAPFFDCISANNKENTMLASMRDLLLPRLMSGQIRLIDTEKEVEEVL